MDLRRWFRSGSGRVMAFPALRHKQERIDDVYVEITLHDVAQRYCATDDFDSDAESERHMAAVTKEVLGVFAAAAAASEVPVAFYEFGDELILELN